MMSTPATADEVTSLLGEVDASVVQEILGVGASFDEIAEAVAAIEEEDILGARSRTPSTAHVVEVRAILEALVLDEAEPETFYTTSTSTSA